ncbi:MAG: hypothetical protein QW727_03040 [Candidatus Pacearchaeota archaeon]
MKIQPYFDKLKKSKAFKEFISKNPNAYLSSGFFVLDFQNKRNMHQLDYFIPENKKIETFILDEKEIIRKESEPMNREIPQKIDKKINLDLDVLKGIVEDEMKNQFITDKIQKIIAIVQNIEGKLVWNLNCITNEMGVIKIHIDDKNHSILKFEKINLFDIMR